MPNSDDERFEVYLKAFRPRTPEPLQTEKHRQVNRSSLLVAGLAALILVATAFALHSRLSRTHSAQAIGAPAGNEQPIEVYAQPLTIRNANALLATAPSFRAAIDAMAFQPKATPLPKDKRSALAVLSEEKNKL